MENISRRDLTERLIKYWKFRRGIANISRLAKFVQVSRDTVYRWLNREAFPKYKKLHLIKEFLDQEEGTRLSSYK